MVRSRSAPSRSSSGPSTAGARSPDRAPVAAQGPVRTCVGCRKREGAGDLLRVVVVDGNLVPDLRQRLPGRGAWLHPARRCYDLAEHRRAFGRALRVPAPLDSSRVRAVLPEDDDGPRTPPAKGGGRRPLREQVDRREQAVKSHP